LRLRDLTRSVLVPAFQLDNGGREETEVEGASTVVSEGARQWTPRFFHNLRHSTVLDEKLSDIALRTSAAPTFFPVYQGYVDGGTFATNPAMCAVSTAIAAGIHLEDIVVLSISTGRDGLYISSDKVQHGDWGVAQWALKLPDLMLDSTIEMTEYQCTQLLGYRYQRIDPALGSNIPIDDPSKIPLLEHIANQVDLSHTKDWLLKFWRQGLPRQTAGHYETTPTTEPMYSPAPELPGPAHAPAHPKATAAWGCVHQ